MNLSLEVLEWLFEDSNATEKCVSTRDSRIYATLQQKAFQPVYGGRCFFENAV